MKLHKRLCVILFALTLLLSLLPLPTFAAPEASTWDGAIAGSFAGGAGTEGNPYLIQTPQQLAYLAKSVNSGTSYRGSFFRLDADLKLNDTAGWERWGIVNNEGGIVPANRWTPIGRMDHAFSGSFDGGGHTISGMYADGRQISATPTGYDYSKKALGLFGFVSGGTVRNLNVVASLAEDDGYMDTVELGMYYVGLLAGQISNGRISGCSVAGKLVTGGWCFSSRCGGIAGTTENSAFEDCENSCRINGGGNGSAGGIAGYAAGGEFNLCKNTGEITFRGGDDADAGGIVGTATGSVTLRGCSNAGAILGWALNGQAAGLIGNPSYAYETVTVSYCYNIGNISGSGFSPCVAGLVGGYGYEGNITISDSYNAGAVTVNDGVSPNVGGIISVIHSGSVRNCYNIGKITGGGGSPKLGGIAGSRDSASVTNCYYLNTSVSGSNGYGTALTDSQMRQADSFSGFDFRSVWTMQGNPTYPYPELLVTDGQQTSFLDVPDEAYYAKAVAWAVKNEIAMGTGLFTFNPDEACTRAQVVTFLWRTLGKAEPKIARNPFTDVQKDAFYYKPVLWAVEQAITKGTGDGKFSPSWNCTRGQVVTFLWRVAGEPEPNSTKNPFHDIKSSTFYYKAVLWAVEQGITKGTSSTSFSPDEACTRAQVVTFLYRAAAK